MLLEKKPVLLQQRAGLVVEPVDPLLGRCAMDPGLLLGAEHTVHRVEIPSPVRRSFGPNQGEHSEPQNHHGHHGEQTEPRPPT